MEGEGVGRGGMEGEGVGSIVYQRNGAEISGTVAYAVISEAPCLSSSSSTIALLLALTFGMAFAGLRIRLTDNEEAAVGNRTSPLLPSVTPSMREIGLGCPPAPTFFLGV
jgi:hypothetical protein